jgi:hypothetical protein
MAERVMFHVKHFNSFNVGVSVQTKTAGDAHLIDVALRMDTHSIF